MSPALMSAMSSRVLLELGETRSPPGFRGIVAAHQPRLFRTVPVWTRKEPSGGADISYRDERNNAIVVFLEIPRDGKDKRRGRGHVWRC